jgi:ribulose-5-phosphate 4-epimerase/fuculose-1-phosphate aldolase
VAGRDVAEFVDAGRTLLSLGLVKGSEGNLSVFDGTEMAITVTGSELGRLTRADVVTGTLESQPPRSSSDLERHVAIYRENGPGAVAHAHPTGTVPNDWVEGQDHGVYAFAPTLEEAVDRIVRDARSSE